jgi:hypothetical protein
VLPTALAALITACYQRCCSRLCISGCLPLISSASRTYTQGRAPAALDARAGRTPYMRPFAGLARRLESSMARLSARLLSGQEPVTSGLEEEEGEGRGVGMSAAGGGLLGGGPGAAGGAGSGPVSGLVAMDGWLGGSPAAPQASLQVTLAQGAVGDVKLRTVRLIGFSCVLEIPLSSTCVCATCPMCIAVVCSVYTYSTFACTVPIL